MKKIKIMKKDLRSRSFEEVLAGLSKHAAFRKGYAEEIARRHLAKQIRELRIAQRLAQKMIAKRAEMPQSVMARIEGGEHSISVDTLNRVAHALGKKVTIA